MGEGQKEVGGLRFNGVKEKCAEGGRGLPSGKRFWLNPTVIPESLGTGGCEGKCGRTEWSGGAPGQGQQLPIRGHVPTCCSGHNSSQLCPGKWGRHSGPLESEMDPLCPFPENLWSPEGGTPDKRKHLRMSRSEAPQKGVTVPAV